MAKDRKRKYAPPVPVPERKAKAATAKAPASSLLRSVLLGWSTVALGALLVLGSLGVKLGQGSLYYRYSPLQGARTLRGLLLLPIAALVVGAVLSIGRRDRPATAWAGRACALAALLLLGAWTWWAPPQPLIQHSFNMRSPSHEGAFFLETLPLKSLRAYLQQFDAEIQKPPNEMGGTRVISNPPGMTIVAVAQQRWWPPQVNPPGPLERWLLAEDTPEWDLPLSSNTIRYSIVLTGLWVAAGAVLYGVARMYLPAPGALVFALVAGFNPSTVHFVPGKDPAQLLTIGLMAWAWLAGMRRWPVPLSFAAGVALATGLASGLIHAWVFVALFVATAWHAGFVRTIVWQAIPAGVGCVVFMLAVWAAGWNVAGSLMTVAKRFGEIQGTFAIDRFVWVLIGVPLFLMFVSPGLVAGIVMTARRWSVRGFGTKLMLATAGAMAATYLTGVTYELPRLWVAFLPTLTLGAMIDLPLMRARHGRAAVALAMIAVVQILVTGLHWTRLDVRESEFRLMEKRFFT